jgi:hypothetical protein
MASLFNLVFVLTLTFMIGGTSTRFFLEQEMICESVPKYARGTGGHSHGGTGGMSGMSGMSMRKRQMGGATAINSNIDHIEEQPACVFNKPVPIKKGQDMFIKADYDFTEHPG